MRLPTPPTRYDPVYESERDRIIEQEDALNAKTNRDNRLNGELTVDELTTADGLTIGDGTTITGHLSGELAAWDPASIAAGGSATTTVAVTGALTTDDVDVAPVGQLEAGLYLDAWVSSADTVTVRLQNFTSGAIDPASRDYRVRIWRR